MRRAAVIALAAGAALAGPPAAASAASVQVQVVGRTRVLRGPTTVRLTDKRRVDVGSRRCTVSGATPLAVLARARLTVRLKDYGACGSSTRDAAGLFVRRVGPDRNRGRDGWVYKVGRRAGTAGAADPGGSFGDGRRLRDGQRVTWFWCVLSASDSCQRTLEVTPARSSVAPGEPLPVTVRGYDDAGHGVVVEGATVSLESATATTGPDGRAIVTTPADAAAGPLRLTARRDGLVPAFAREVTVR